MRASSQSIVGSLQFTATPWEALREGRTPRADGDIGVPGVGGKNVGAPTFTESVDIPEVPLEGWGRGWGPSPRGGVA
jgi:hypothetical protein